MAESQAPKDQASNDEVVGYGKPPKATQFKKGRSGNPKGRPRKVRERSLKLSDGSFEDFFEHEVYRTIRVIDGGSPTEMPVVQATIRSIVTGALKGNRLSQQVLLKWVQDKEEQRVREKHEFFAHMRACKLKGEKILAIYRKADKAPPELIPHPDDIVLDEIGREVVIDGPTSAEEARRFEQLTKLRDYFAQIAARVCTHGRVLENVDGRSRMNLAWFLACVINRNLPTRYRWDDLQPVSIVMGCNMPKREWKRHIAKERAWLEGCQLFQDDRIHSRLPSLPKALVQTDSLAENWFFVDELAAVKERTRPRC